MHSDVWQSPTVAHLGFWYYVIFVDDYSCFTWFYPMKWKSDVFPIFTNFKTMLKKQSGLSIKIFHSDGGGEFDNSPMQNLFLQSGILFRKSCPDSQAQSGVAERKHCHLREMVCGFLDGWWFPHSSSFTISILG